MSQPTTSVSAGRRRSRRQVMLKPSATVFDLGCARIEKSLQQRTRYRYVHPTVSRVGSDYLVSSPCCSRNVDPDGGVIEIALFTPLNGGGWLLSARDHASQQWVQYDEAPHLQPLLDQVCADPTRVFWP